ncbi:MAG: hypothetical protein KGL67_00390 [Patescibacteria group bacterium]|nr:hypothetical protein [Patescibacteria group bacterium]
MENNNIPQNKIVQTYAEDMAHVLEEDKGGLIKKIIHGEEEHEKEKRELSPQSKKNKFFMFLGMLLTFISLGTLFFFIFQRSAPSVPVQKQFIPIIFTDKDSLLELADLKKDAISAKFFNAVNNTTVKPGGIEGMYPTLNKGPVGLRQFITIIEGNFTPGTNNFIDDNFFMGAFNSADQTNPSISAGKSFFMLLKMRSIPDIFDTMHAWEPKLFVDLHGFFGINFSPDTKYLLTKEFQDGIVENKNARILYDTDNKIVMMYVFADDNSVVITNSENAVHEIILRLASSQIKK